MKSVFRLCFAAAATAASLVGAPAVFAADLAPGAIPCDGVQQNKAACLQEKGAAAEMARHGAFPNVDPNSLRQNALARCSRQPADDRAACEARVTGAGATNVTGSVLGGGVLRTTETPVPAAAQ